MKTKKNISKLNKLKIKFIIALNRYKADWKNDSMFKNNPKQNKKNQELEISKKLIKGDKMSRSQSNFFVARSKSSKRKHKKEHRKSQANIVKNLLNEQENIMNQKFLSKRLKSQRENYILKTNSGLRLSDARVTMTSLQKVRTYKDKMDECLLPSSHISSRQNLGHLQTDNYGNSDIRFVQNQNHIEFLASRENDIFSNNKGRVFLTDPDFVKYTQEQLQTRKFGSSLGPRNQIQVAKFKQIKRDNEDYHSFRESLRTKKINDKSTNLNTQNKFLAQLQSMKELDDLLNPANRDIDKDEEKELELAQMLNDIDKELPDSELENKLLDVQNTEILEGFEKYMEIMLGRHLKFNDIEEAEIKNRKLEDLDLDNIIEHFISKKTILEKVVAAFTQYKSTKNK